MASFNRVILVGNLTRDVEFKVLQGGTGVSSFGIATNRKWKDKGSGEDKEDVCFVDCTAFGKTAEIISQHFEKGKPILVEGRLKYESWEDKQGGKRSKLIVVVENFQFIGSKADGGGQGAPSRPTAAASGASLEDEIDAMFAK